MNIFYLSNNHIENAKYHHDKHLIKMITEYSQLLSTAHRILDGKMYYEKRNNRKIKRWKLNGEKENLLMKATHINHPCNIWVRSNEKNYLFLKELLIEMLNEYFFRFNKKDKFNRSKLISKLNPPKNIPNLETKFPQAMPEEYKDKNPIKAYRKYYVGKKLTNANWTNREIPLFINENMYTV